MTDVAQPRNGRGSVVTIGAYDGVHLGHRKVLALVRELADVRDLDAALVTFDRHPASVVRPDSAPKILTSLQHKLDLLDELGLLDEIVVIEFDLERSRESAEDFVHRVLVDQLDAKVVVVGEDFHFGHKRGGNVAMLSRMGTDLDFEVIGLNLIAPEGGPGHAPYSSTRIRALVADGDVAGAAELLGRPHAVRGTVVRGDNRGGTELGFPTANVAVAPDTAMPANGIYAGQLVDPDGVVRTAAISLGTRPTFHPDAHESVLEVFVLDFDGDLYDTEVEVRFVEHLRGEERFDSVDALVEQMHRDVAETRRLLEG